jgi:hypothetical protein
MRRIAISATIAAAFMAAPIADATAKKIVGKSPASPAAQPWTREPDGFLGIKFGEPFPDFDAIPDCPKNGNSIDFAVVHTMRKLCFDGYGRTSYGTLWNTPDLGFGYAVNVMIEDGMPVSFIIQTQPSTFDELEKVLIQRYGVPTSTVAGTVKAGSGAEFDNLSLRWIGQKVTIDAEMRSGQVDESKTFINDKAYWDARESQRNKASEEGSARL